MAKELPIIARIKDAIAGFKRELALDIPKQLEEARAHGDLKENAEYHATKERQGILNARIAQLENRLASLQLFSLASIPHGVIGYGSRVEAEDVDSGETMHYELVFAEESDPARGLISVNSPIAQALLNRAEGDEVTVQTPRGKVSLEVVSVTTIREIMKDSDGE